MPRRMPGAIKFEEAVQVAQEALGQGASFPFPQYPLVKETNGRVEVRFDEPVNVVLIFVEGLDRRYLDRTIDVSADSTQLLAPGTPSSQPIRLTPFLDRLKDESLYFENFFSNGVATTRALLSTFCSYYPRQGTAAIKTRYEQDYLCLPSLLRKGGFRTEMVISLDSDIPGIRPFMARNGLDRFFGESDFPANAERLGVGLTDGALFGFMRTRIETLQTREEPFFLAALTSSTHHPFTIPLRHPEVRTVFPRSADFQHAPSVYHSIAASGGAGPATSQRSLRRGSSLLRLGIRDFFYVTAAGRAAQELDGDRNRGSWSP